MGGEEVGAEVRRDRWGGGVVDNDDLLQHTLRRGREDRLHAPLDKLSLVGAGQHDREGGHLPGTLARRLNKKNRNDNNDDFDNNDNNNNKDTNNMAANTYSCFMIRSSHNSYNDSPIQ